MNLIMCIKDKSFKRIILKSHFLFLLANITFFIYALGISLCNLDSHIFLNSMPTRIGNSIPLILNLIMVIGKIVYNHKNIRSKVKK
jgi:uncharacterized protein with PQ loop repeat